MIYHNGSDNIRLPRGTEAHVLTLQGQVPVWKAAPGTGNVSADSSVAGRIPFWYNTSRKLNSTSILYASGDGIGIGVENSGADHRLVVYGKSSSDINDNGVIKIQSPSNFAAITFADSGSTSPHNSHTNAVGCYHNKLWLQADDSILAHLEKVSGKARMCIGRDPTSYTAAASLDILTSDNVAIKVENATYGCYHEFRDAGTSTNYAPKIGVWRNYLDIRVGQPQGDPASNRGGVNINWPHNMVAWPSDMYIMKIDEQLNDGTNGGAAATNIWNARGWGYITGSWAEAASDERVKENVVTIDSALDKVCAMRGVYFKWKYNSLTSPNAAIGNVQDTFMFNSDGTKRNQIGVISQEMKEVLPEVVHSTPVPVPDSEESEEHEVLQTVKYDHIVPILIEAIKELKQEVDDLKSQLDGSE
jgi:hypothetical protein